MSPRPPACRRSRRRRVLGTVVASVLVAACGAESGVTTERADVIDPSATVEPDEPDDTEPDDTPPDETQPEETQPDGTPPDETPPDDTTDPPDPDGGSIEWEELFDGVETGLLDVPVDYEDPDGPQFELFVARRLADDQDGKIGSLLVNPGGPGFGGSDFAIYADQIYGDELLERFDIVGWDPRGTGLSEPAIDCIDDYDEFFGVTDITPDDDAERAESVELAQRFAEECEANSGDILEHVGTNNSARDMDAIRQALGEEQISYFGFSYGSELGGTWTTLFPETVRAAVFDGAIDPTETPLERGLSQVTGFERSIATYLADCSADDGCPFHNDGDAEGAFDALMLELDENPIESEPGRPDVTRAIALQGVAQAMYSPDRWEQLSEALADAQDGRGAGLLALNDAYFQRRPDGTWGNELEAFNAIRCADDPERKTVEEEDAEAPLYQEAGPRFSPGTIGGYFCTFFPPAVDPRVDITGAGAGPIVVVGTTGDPATPIESTRGMAAVLEDGRLVVVTAEGHTGYGSDDCADDIVHGYLTDLEIPAAETEC